MCAAELLDTCGEISCLYKYKDQITLISEVKRNLHCRASKTAQSLCKYLMVNYVDNTRIYRLARIYRPSPRNTLVRGPLNKQSYARMKLHITLDSNLTELSRETFMCSRCRKNLASKICLDFLLYSS